MINFDPNVNSILPHIQTPASPTDGAGAGKGDFSNAVKAVGKYLI